MLSFSNVAFLGLLSKGKVENRFRSSPRLFLPTSENTIRSSRCLHRQVSNIEFKQEIKLAR